MVSEQETAKDAAIQNADFTNVFQAKTAFGLGFDAGVEFACGWVTVSEAGLPKQNGWYLVRLTEPVACSVTEFIVDKSPWQNVTAYMRRPITFYTYSGSSGSSHSINADGFCNLGCC